MTGRNQIIGLIPAAGRGSRMGTLPFSKELLPLSSCSPIGAEAHRRPRVAIDNALEVMASAGIQDTCIVIGRDKWDIPAHTGSGEPYGQDIAYVIAEESPSVPSSLDQAWFLTRDKEVALLFPDIVFEPRSALQEIISERRKNSTDLTLALVPTASGEKIDIVTTTGNGEVERVIPKPGPGYSGWTWVAAVWNPDFNSFLHNMLLSSDIKHPDPVSREFYVADLINASIDAGYQVSSMLFPDGMSFDLGTYEELTKYWQSGID